MNCSGMELDIRLVLPEDVDRVAEIEELCFPSGEAAVHGDFVERIATFPKSFFVGQVGGEIVAFVNGPVTNRQTIVDEMYHNLGEYKEDGDYQAIFGVCTHPEYQKKGLAQAMLHYIIDVTKQREKKGMILTCKDHLIHYYEKFGFENQGISASIHGGAVWYDMILEFKKSEKTT